MENNSIKLTINPQIKNVYGFLILSCCSILIGKVSKNKKEILFEQKIEFEDILAKMRKRRDPCAGRFRWLIIERERKVTKFIDEHLEQFFIKDNMINISGLIIAGPKNPIERYLTFDNRKLTMAKYITTIIELEYDGKTGFDEAIQISMINNNL